MKNKFITKLLIILFYSSSIFSESFDYPLFKTGFYKIVGSSLQIPSLKYQIKYTEVVYTVGNLDWGIIDSAKHYSLYFNNLVGQDFEFVVQSRPIVFKIPDRESQKWFSYEFEKKINSEEYLFIEKVVGFGTRYKLQIIYLGNKLEDIAKKN